MRRVGRLIKRLSALFLVLIFCIESFGAVIDDYDGAAFARKDEFEELKANFDKQIDDYNKSIDNKIDGAIASYLSSVDLNDNPKNLYNDIVVSIGEKMRFLNNFDNEWSVGTATDTAAVSAVHQRTYRYQKSVVESDWKTAYWLHKPSLQNINLYFGEDLGGTGAQLLTEDFDFWQYSANVTSQEGWKWCNVCWNPSVKSIAKNYLWYFLSTFDKGVTEFSSLTNQRTQNGHVSFAATRFGSVKADYQNWNYIQFTAWNGTNNGMWSSNFKNGPSAGTGSSGTRSYSDGWSSGTYTQDEGFFAFPRGSYAQYFGDTNIENAFKACNSVDKPFAIIKGPKAPSGKSMVALWISSFQSSGRNYYEVKGNWISAIPSSFTHKTNNSVLANSAKTQTGSGSGWRYRNLPNGNKTITAYNSKLYPNITINFKYHSYKDKSSSTASSGSYSDTDARSQTLNNNPTLGITSGGTDHGAASTSTGGYWQQLLSLYEEASPVVFETVQWGADLSGNLYMVPEKGYTFARNGTMATTLTNGPSISWSDDGFDHTATAPTNDTYTMKLNRESIAKTSFENSYLSAVAGETVYVGGGCPIAEIKSPVDTKLTLNFNVKTKADTGTTVAGITVNYKISDKQFVAGEFAPGARNIATGTAVSDTSGNASASIDLESFPIGTKFWINCYASTKPHMVVLQNVNIVNAE